MPYADPSSSPYDSSLVAAIMRRKLRTISTNAGEMSPAGGVAVGDAGVLDQPQQAAGEIQTAVGGRLMRRKVSAGVPLNANEFDNFMDRNAVSQQSAAAATQEEMKRRDHIEQARLATEQWQREAEFKATQGGLDRQFHAGLQQNAQQFTMQRDTQQMAQQEQVYRSRLADQTSLHDQAMQDLPPDVQPFAKANAAGARIPEQMWPGAQQQAGGMNANQYREYRMQHAMAMEPLVSEEKQLQTQLHQYGPVSMADPPETNAARADIIKRLQNVQVRKAAAIQHLQAVHGGNNQAAGAGDPLGLFQ